MGENISKLNYCLHKLKGQLNLHKDMKLLFKIFHHLYKDVILKRRKESLIMVG